MARYKSEFLADYWSRHGTPNKARALGNVHRLSEWGSRLAPVSNWISASAPARWMNERLLDLDARRTPPPWKRETFERWLARHPRPLETATATLFNDTFTNHYDPEIGIAALEVLDRGGCRAGVVRPGCCGRPFISQGLLKEARAQAAQVTEALYPIASRGEKIIFCEPSCLSAVKEDAPSLLRGDQQKKARAVAEACVLFEEFAAHLELALCAGPQRILLHGHCHQKSMGLLEASKLLLSRIPSATVVDLDAGCCGMAGSFGYTRGHYDVSVAIANRKLLPAVKAMQPGDVLVAPGTSCRRQVADLQGATALHPAIVIRDLLA
ncbi:MAG TPA: heterodisulfide reductase-related iron-sulfur binding cluster, partial [Bryobacteraceae bacterium]|nr:heterodisulfide reductase-related iron-sulfur binding cluster [Bryobacteraceae bacterium]